MTAKVNFVKAARKDNPVAKKGESYYWWSFKFGGKHYSRTYPARYQLTQSEFLSRLWELEDNIPNDMSPEEAEDFAGELESLRDEVQDHLDNMPEGLQDGDTGQLMQSRIDSLEEWADSIRNLDFEELSPEEVAEEVSALNPGID